MRNNWMRRSGRKVKKKRTEIRKRSMSREWRRGKARIKRRRAR